MRILRIGLWAAVVALCLAVGGLLAFQALNRDSDRSLTFDTKLGAPFTLVDHNGDAITETAMTGHPVAVFFGFTHCPEVCPTTLNDLSVWLGEMGAKAEPIRAFFITVDPERDTPELMKGYVENFSDRITGITGDPDQVAALARAWHVYWKKVPLDGDDYTMDHTASVFLVGPDGSFITTIAFGESAEMAKSKLARLAATAKGG